MKTNENPKNKLEIYTIFSEENLNFMIFLIIIMTNVKIIWMKLLGKGELKKLETIIHFGI